MKKISLIMTLSLLVVAHEAEAQTRGFMEAFGTKTVADSWNCWVDGTVYYPGWVDGTDPYIYGSFQNTPAFLYADTNSSSGKLTGDYTAARIAAIGADVYVDYPSQVEAVDIYIYSSYNDTYYCYGYWAFVDANWHGLTAPLDATNWWVNSLGYTSIPSQALAQVAETGIIAYPVGGLAQYTYVNLDNFTLVPQLIRPSLTIDRGGGQTQVHFWSEQGQSYAVKICDNLVTQNWHVATGCEDIVGMDCGVTVYDSSQGSPRFYRVVTDAHYSN